MKRVASWAVGILAVVPLLLASPVSADAATDCGDLDTARGRTSATVRANGDYAYVFGGQDSTGLIDDIQQVDLSNCDADVPATLAAATSSTAACSDGGDAYIAGGIRSTGDTDKFYKYNMNQPLTAPTQLANLPIGLHRSALVCTGDDVVLLGGANGSTIQDKVYKYSILLDTWAEVVTWKLSEPRHGLVAVFIGPHIWIFGGKDNGANCLGTLKRMEITTGTSWENKQGADARYASAGVVAAGDSAGDLEIRVLAGETCGSGLYSGYLSYDLSDDAWTTHSSHYSSGRYVLSAIADGSGNVFAFGGKISATSDTFTNEIAKN